MPALCALLKRVLNIRPVLSLVGVAVLVLGVVLSPCRSLAADPAPEKAEKAAEAGKPSASGGIKVLPTPASSAAPTSAPTPDPTEVSKTCAKAVAGLLAGDTAAIDSLPSENRTGLTTTPAALHAYTCLAVASGEKRYCEALEGENKGKCLDQLKMVGELKDLPKERVKPEMLHRMCVASSAKAECDKLRDAVAAGDAAKCAGLGNAVMKDFCAAMASGDATKCQSVPEGEERSRCEAYTADDPNRCAKDSVDCRNMAGAFAAVKKQGLAGVADIDPGAAAAIKGKSACEPLLSALQAACVK